MLSLDELKYCSNWKKSHLLPVIVPEGNSEHPALSVERDEVLEAARQGFAVAFNLLAPVSGVEFEGHLTGERVTELLFMSNIALDTDVLERSLYYSGEAIVQDDDNFVESKDDAFPYLTSELDLIPQQNSDINSKILEEECPIEKLLGLLPGIQADRMECLSSRLYNQIK